MDTAFFHWMTIFVVTLLQFCTQTESSITVSSNSPIRGSTAELVCSFVSTVQDIVVKWEREVDGQDVPIAAYNFKGKTSEYNAGDDRYVLQYEETTKSSNAILQILGVSLDDIGKYKCERFGVGSDTESLQLEVLVPPDDIGITDTRSNTQVPHEGVLRVTAGEPTAITCLTDFRGTRPATELVWRAEDNIVDTPSVATMTETPAEPRLTQTISRMNFSTSFAAHGTWLECQGNHDGLQEPLRARVTLDVDVPPSMIQLKKSIIADYYDGETVMLTQGSPFTVSCIIPGTKPEVSIDWFLDRQPLDPSFSRNTVNIIANPGNSLLKDTTGVLEIPNPGREYHGKSLRCVGTGADGIQIEGSLSLLVKGPPDEPEMVELPGNIREGEGVRFACSAHNGYPAPNISWMIDGRINVSANATQGTFDYGVDRYTTSSVLQFYPTPEYNGRELSCVVADYNDLQATVTLDIKYCPRMFHFTSCPAVRDGDIVSVTCEVGPSNPALGLTLSLNGTQLAVDPREERYTGLGYPGLITRLDYTSSRIRRENGPLAFSCCIEDRMGVCPAAPCELCNLDIQYQPIITSISMTPESGIRIGRKVIISCQAEANPMTDKLIQWEVQESGSTQWVTYNHTNGEKNGANEWRLVFEEVQISDAKGYRCVASNGIGGGVYSSAVELAVMYAPIILDSVPTLVRTQERGEKALTCQAWGNPTPTISWYNGTRSRMETDPGNHIISESIVSENNFNGSLVNGELNFFKISREKHFGVYYCNATNSYGTTLLKIVLNGTSAPEPPINLRELQALTSSTTLTFLWTPGEDGGETQQFEVSFCPKQNPSECVDKTQTIANYTATNLRPYTRYRISVYSRNAVGYSSHLNKEAITLPLSPDKEGIEIAYNSASGEVLISENPSGSSNMNELPCVKLDVRLSTSLPWEEQLLPCLKKDVKVTIPKDLPLSSIRVKSCIPDSDKCSTVGPLVLTVVSEEPPTTLIIIIAVIVACILLVIIIILVLVCRRKPSQTNVHSGEHLEMKKRTDGYKSFSKDYDNNTGRGEKEAFLPPDSNSPTTNNTNGLIYAEIGHMGEHPTDQPPIQTEVPTEYADLDFLRMQEIKENKKNEENTRNEAMKQQIQSPPPPTTIYHETAGLECV
ncbi:nephrin-like isoform X3 [Apostichopus japonicus]|uniref:nephrin-like isoform X3 n=1 Tax=Stichopus japonicus TaxID=307972 RepID=UPI003AB5885D